MLAFVYRMQTRRIPASAWVAFIGAAALTASVRLSTTVSASVDASALPLVQQGDTSYVGAFRVPLPLSQEQTYEFGGTALSYWPAHNSLLLAGHDWYQLVGEMSIPTPGTGASVDQLPRATSLQALTDILAGKRTTVDGGSSNGVKIGGILPVGSSLVVTAWDYYDTGIPSQTRSHFVTGQNFSNLGGVQGPFQVGTGYTVDGSPQIAGFVSGYIAPIPAEWQSILGGTVLTGNGGNISVLYRTSSGPAANAFKPSDLGVTTPAPATKLMGYPINHSTLGTWGVEGGLYNGSQSFRGMIFPEGTRSVLFYGWGGTFCYGAGTTDPSKHLQPLPNDPAVHYCYDLSPGGVDNKGTHSYPTLPIVWAYDVNDFVAVKNGSKQPWDIRPYATWTFTLPFQSKMVNGLETGNFGIIGASYDPATNRIFLSTSESDGTMPLIHVLSLHVGSPGPKALCYW